MEFETGEEKEYHFLPLEGESLRFTLKAAHDGHLAFTEGEGETEPMFEVFLGGWENTASAVRFNKADDLVKVDTPDLLNADDSQDFWVVFDHGHVRVGKSGEWQPILECQLPQEVKATHFGYSTGWGASGSWQFYHDRLLMTDDTATYHFESVYGDSFSFRVCCCNDAHLALTTAPEAEPPMYEVFIGGWENSHSAIRLNNDPEQTVVKVDTPSIVCDEEDRLFHITFRNGEIKMFKEKEKEPFMQWTDESPLRILYIGFRTNWGASGKWKLEV